MSNKTSDKNVANIEDDVKIVKEFIDYAQEVIDDMEYERPVDVTVYQKDLTSIKNILAEREQMLKEREKYTIRLTDEEYRKVIENAQMDTSNDRVIAIKFAIMQQQINEKDKRIKELEEESRKKSIELICYQEELENSISTQVVIDKIKENSNIEKEIEEKIKEEENSGDICREYIRDLKRQKGLVKRDILTLQELLEGEK